MAITDFFKNTTTTRAAPKPHSSSIPLKTYPKELPIKQPSRILS
jgi:hypothetical protein